MTDKELLALWESEFSAIMPEDMKDWWENTKEEWPIVAVALLKNYKQQLEWWEEGILRYED